MTTKSQDRRKVRLSRALGIPLTPKAARYLETVSYTHLTLPTKRIV